MKRKKSAGTNRIRLQDLPSDTLGTRALKGLLSSKKGKRMAFSEVRKAAARAAFGRDNRAHK